MHKKNPQKYTSTCIIIIAEKKKSLLTHDKQIIDNSYNILSHSRALMQANTSFISKLMLMFYVVDRLLLTSSAVDED